jgi:hypothetical protein
MRRTLLFLVALTISCSGYEATRPAQSASEVYSLTIVAHGALLVGTDLPLQVIVRDANNAQVEGFPVIFSSSAPAVATVSSAGVVRGLREGDVTITATIAGTSAQVKLTVRPAGTPLYPGTVAGFVLTEADECIIGAQVEVVDGPRAGSRVTQTTCGFWDYGIENGYAFTFSSGEAVTFRATAAGYKPAQIRAFPTNPYQYTTYIVLTPE